MLFATLWNTGIRIGESRTLTPESFDLDGLRPFVRVLSEKVRARHGRPPKDEVRLVPLTDVSFVHQEKSWRMTPHPHRRASLWSVINDDAQLSKAGEVHFSIPVMSHTFHHIAISCICFIINSPESSSRRWSGTRIRTR